MKQASIRIGGALHVVLTIFHALFPVMFAWKETLACLSPINRAIMYALGNHATLVLAAFTYVSFAYTAELTNTRLGRAVARVIALFYLLRIVEEWTLFSSPVGSAVGLSVLCGVLCGIYGVASIPSNARSLPSAG